MSHRYIFWGMVITAAAATGAAFAALGNYALAALAVGLGALWLVADAKITSRLATLFFLAFVGLAVVVSLNKPSLPLAVLGVSANLAAWDMSRFLTRLTGENVKATRAILEARHLRALTTTVGAGFAIALLPTAFRLSIPFAIVCGLVLLTLLMLRLSTRSL